MMMTENYADQESRYLMSLTVLEKMKKGYKLIAKKLAYNITENTIGLGSKVRFYFSFEIFGIYFCLHARD